MEMNVKSVTMVRTLAVWGAFLTVLAVIPYGAFLAIKQLFGVEIPISWQSYLAFWVLIAILKVDVSFKVHP